MDAAGTWIRFSAIMYVAVAFLLLSCATLPTPAAAGTAAGTHQVRDFDLRYRVTGEGGPGQIHVQFAAPDRWRIERRDRKTDEIVVAAGASVFTYDRTKRAVLWQARDQAHTYCDLEINLASPRESRPQAEPEQTSQFGFRKSLADDKVLGRDCRVDEAHFEPPESPIPMPAITSKRWVDKQLMLGLRVETCVGGSLDERVEATSVQVNRGVPERAFRFQIPRGVRVFKGALTSVPDPRFLREAPMRPSYGSLIDFGELDQAGKATTFYVPEYVPKGFHVVSTLSGVGDPWLASQLASASGATIVFEESRDLKANPLPGLPGGSAVAIGELTGQIAERHKPFERIVLTWQVADWRLRIDAAGVPKSEIMKMAGSVKERTATPERKATLRDPVEAQAKVNFLVLVPKGFTPVSINVTPYSKQGSEGDYTETPEQISMAYANLRGGIVSLLEMRASGLGGQVIGRKRITISGPPGWYKYDADIGHMFDWEQEGTDVSLSGKLPKAEMLKIAESLAPADPSARERVKQYQEQHPQSDLGPAGGQEFADALTAQAQVNFLVLVPNPLPKGFAPGSIFVTPYSKQGSAGDHTETPEQISIAYANLRGDMFSLLETRGRGLRGQIVGAKRITISGPPGWYKYDADIGHMFAWEQEGTHVSLSGKLPKAQMQRIAESLVPADPSARERVKKYQAEHRSLFDIFGGN